MSYKYNKPPEKVIPPTIPPPAPPLPRYEKLAEIIIQQLGRQPHIPIALTKSGKPICWCENESKCKPMKDRLYDEEC